MKSIRLLALAFFDEVICYARDVVAMVDVGQLVYLGQALFSEGVDDDSVSVLCCSGDVFYESIVDDYFAGLFLVFLKRGAISVSTAGVGFMVMFGLVFYFEVIK